MAVNFFPEWRSEDYYFFLDDVRKYPEAWALAVWSRRGPGKTYSFLRSMYENKIMFAYIKRTNKDVQTICSNKFNLDMSPFVPINRDTGSTIVPRLISDGIGGFYESTDDKGNPAGSPIGYVLSLNAIKEIKGMELSAVDYICIDEFIPLPGEKVLRTEGELLLSIYMTVLRDRMKRGREQLRLVMFSNADNVSTPITNELEIVDDMVNLSASGRSHYYNEERGILLHHITDEEIPIQEVEKTGIYKAMDGTTWAAKAFGGEFASNDFSAIHKQNLRGFHPVCSYFYKQRYVFVYRNSGEIYVTYTRHDKGNCYDLSKEGEQIRFYYDHVIDIKEAAIEGKLSCETYTMYDLLFNYKKIFRLS